MTHLFWVFLLPFLLSAELPQERLVRRIHDHLVIKDHLSAIEEGKRALELYPDSQEVILAYFRALCEQGEEVQALTLWEKIDAAKRSERAILETLAWGVLNKAKKSSQLEIRLNVLMAAAFTRDAKAIRYILDALQSSNATERDLAVHMVTSFGDTPLKQELERLFKEEKLWYVRLSVMRAIGRLQMKHLKAPLEQILLSRSVSVEEKTSAQVALINMYETITQKELALLVWGERARQRQLACQLVAYLEATDLAEELYPLLQDRVASVRIAAMNALTLLHKKESFPYIEPCLDDPSYDVAITAAWSALLFKPELGVKSLRKWLFSSESEERRMAAGALVAAGARGCELSLEAMSSTQDVYVKATLAMGLMRQRRHLDKAHKELYACLTHSSSEQWMWDTKFNPLFHSLAPSRVRHRADIAQFPKVVDQMVRLELLSLLCTTGYSKAEEAIRGYLQSHSWGVTGAAATILLEEGDEFSMEISHELLRDKDEKVRLQAALLLAVMGKSEEALPILYEAYPRLNRGMKLHVLQAIAQVGEPSSIPFLLAQFKEPFQVLRVAAASALIQSLYR